MTSDLLSIVLGYNGPAMLGRLPAPGRVGDPHVRRSSPAAAPADTVAAVGAA
jgi:hypothetical protein